MLDMQQLKELLLQSLEHERGGVNLYETAIRCAISEDLKHQWSVYLEQTHTHVQILEEVVRKLEIDSEEDSTKDHMNWELLTKCTEHLRGSHKRALEEACEIVEEQEDEHLYHSRGYCRELWLDALGLPAILPPPEEMQHVRSAISAAQAQQQSERNR